MTTGPTLKDLLERHAIAPVVPPHWKGVALDLSSSNQTLNNIDLNNQEVFESYISNTIQGYDFGWGGYGENRNLYRRSPHFDTDEEPRTIHLGIDVWAPAGTEIMAPLPGKIHSFSNQNELANYGPVLILEHTLGGHVFYSLYGHLSKSDLINWRKGKPVNAGDCIGEIGKWHENGNWPPHLHLQLMTKMSTFEGDFPGVCTHSEKQKWLQICPNPEQFLPQNP